MVRYYAARTLTENMVASDCIQYKGNELLSFRHLTERCFLFGVLF